jgi:CDP-diacylglycerol--serine O-phosphatidyltransferase
MKKRDRGRRRVRRVVVVVPSIFTLANLFFGFWSIVLAAQGDFYRASWWIVIAGILDTLDGLSARVSKTDSAFGAQLDSVVDMVSFGIAPAVLMFFLLFSPQETFAWMFSYAFVVCAALRLARFNTQSDRGHKGNFTGLPSTAAGTGLAVYYPFTQTAFYQTQLQALPWSQIMIFLMIALSLAMVSNVEYAKLPRIGVRTLRGVAGLIVYLIVLWFGIFNRDIFFFPMGMTYLVYGMARGAVVAIMERGDEESDEIDERPQLVIHEMEERQQKSDP